MDFGFTGLKTFEDYLGRTATKVLAYIVSIALAAFCMSTIWDHIIDPLLKLFATPVWGVKVGNVAWMVVTVLLGVAGGLEMSAALSGWRKVRKLDKQLAESRTLLREMQEASNERTAYLRSTIKEAEALLIRAVQVRDVASGAREEAVRLVCSVLSQSEELANGDGSLTEEARAQLLQHYAELRADLEETDSGSDSRV